MPFRTRVFLLSFVPFALLLVGSFWSVRNLVQSTVRQGLRYTLRENQAAIERLRVRSEMENSRFLRVAGENAALKAGVRLLISAPDNSQARRTVEDQLGELCERMGFDFLMVSDVAGRPLAGVGRSAVAPPVPATVAGVIAPLTDSLSRTPPSGLITMEGRIYQIASVPLDQGDDNIGSLAVGEIFNFNQLNAPTALLHNGNVLELNLAGVSPAEATAALRRCPPATECEIRLGGAGYLSMPLQNLALGSGFELRSLQNLDASTGPVHSILNNLFLVTGIAVLALALISSAVTSETIVKPLMAIVSHLRSSQLTGLLPEFRRDLSPVREVRELTSSFNQAAGAIREARENLQLAYVEFVGSLASALDARDPYTAGHSRRVSELACRTATAMALPQDLEHRLRVGALLHDIGKIGIADTLLGKADRLTAEESAILQAHPVIGRRILENVHGFAPYLAAVELHHENWDGTGYPLGQKGEETPLEARIIHVADAYDAMTTDRPYRRGMSHERAIGILTHYAGSQFDPAVVNAFVAVHKVQPESREAALTTV
jgi:HD-GYP domain-containing protein (c-di-GMP phosphodiesterase class II)